MNAADDASDDDSIGDPLPLHRYRPELDGLRAVAVLCVLLFHADFGLPGGFVGVDVFFVISGYLITGIIARQQDEAGFSSLAFWGRRVRRIVPAMVVTMLGTLLLGALLLEPAAQNELGRSAMWQAVSLSNVYFANDQSYFAIATEARPLLMMWSLAVEEQFYLLLPLVLILTKRWRLAAVIGLLLAGFLWSVWQVMEHPTRAYFLLPSRAFELLAGSAMALWQRDQPIPKLGERAREALAVVALAAAVIPAVLYEKNTPFPGWAALPVVIGTVTLIACNSFHATQVGQLLSLRPLVAIGLISYSLYLWHWPLLAIAKQTTDFTPAIRLGVLAASLLIATLQWRWIEQPFRRPRPSVVSAHSVRRAIGGGMAALAITAAVGAYFAVVPKQITVSDRDRLPAGVWDDTIAPGQTRQTVCDDGRCEPDTIGRGERRLLLCGDSHALMLAAPLDDLLAELGIEGSVVARNSFAAVPGIAVRLYPTERTLAPTLREAMRREITSGKITDVLLVLRWSVYLSGYAPIEQEFRYAMNGRPGPVVQTDDGPCETTAEAVAAFQAGLAELQATCESAGVRLWVMQEVPATNEPHPAKQWARHLLRPTVTPPTKTHSRADYAQRQIAVEEVLSVLDETQIIRVADRFFDADGRTRMIVDGRSVYYDDDHLTEHGVRLYLLDALRSLLTQTILADQAEERTAGESTASRDQSSPSDRTVSPRN